MSLEHPATTIERHPMALVEEPPLYRADLNLSQVTRDIVAPLDRRPNGWWWLAFLIAISLLGVGAITVIWQLRTGLGILGLTWPTMWGTYITNFVFWIGIGHAGTLISAILFLFRQRWRTAINRAAEAMTIFAVMCAGLFPLLHIGRTLLAYWLIPYPNFRHLWVNFRSPLIWDVFAVSTYATISILFWYQGMIPDLATVRDHKKGKIARKIYGIFAMNWRGTARDWNHYESAYGMLAAIATPLVLSVHSNVSMDFAVATAPGWHSTIFPPYFVAGAIFSGFAMVVTLMAIVRKVYSLEDYVTLDHMELMCKIILVTSLMVGYAYATEMFSAWYTNDIYERQRFYGVHFGLTRTFFTGPYAYAAWIMVSCNVLIPQLFWFRRLRRSLPVMFLISLAVNLGMWFERYTIVVSSQARQFLPSSFGYFRPTRFDYAVLAGSFGLFFTLFLLFVRFVPVIAVAEIKAVLRQPVGEPAVALEDSHA